MAKTCYEYPNAYVTLCSFLRVTVVNLDQMVRLDHQVPPVMLVLMVILVKMVKLELRYDFILLYLHTITQVVVKFRNIATDI